MSTPTGFQAKQLRNSDLGKAKPLTFQLVVKYYLLPITAIVVFVAMGLFLVLPAVAKIFTDLDKLSTLSQEAVDVNSQITQVKQLATGLAQTNANLTKIDKIAPEGTAQVVQFQTSIRTISDKNGLEWLEGSGQEQIIDPNTDSTDSDSSELGKVEIPSIFTLRGSLANIRNFISDVLKVDQMVVIKEMALRRNTGSLDTWDLTITLVKYQFQAPDEFNRLEQVYLNVPVTETPDQEVLDLINSKTAGV